MAAILFEPEWEKVKKERNTDSGSDDKCLSEELLFQVILVRLPVKPLLRFKSVCKRWRSLIHSPSFIRSHHRYHFRNSLGKLVHTPYTDSWKHTPSTSPSSFFTNLIDSNHSPVLPPEISLDRLELPYPEDSRSAIRPWRRHICVLGPLNNSIYCLIANLQQHDTMGYTLHTSVVTGKIAFCNPGTRDYKFANPFPSEMVPRLTEFARDRCSRVHYGFGSIDKDHDYKVVVVLTRVTRINITSFLSLVYSHRRGTWETLVDYESGKRHFFNTKVVAGIDIIDTQGKVRYPEIEMDLEICPQGFFNGCWHWIAWKSPDFQINVLSFHMGDEVFKFLGGPPGYVRSQIMHDRLLLNSIGVVSVLNDHLAAFYFTTESCILRDSTLDVWMMMEYGVEDSWAKIYALKRVCPSLKELVGIRSSINEECIGGIQIEKIIYRDVYGKLFSCDDSSVENHGLFDVSSSIFWNALGFSAYRQTLEPVTITVKEDDGFVTNFDQV